jgi:hypothetical protein
VHSPNRLLKKTSGTATPLSRAKPRDGCALLVRMLFSVRPKSSGTPPIAPSRFFPQPAKTKSRKSIISARLALLLAALLFATNLCLAQGSGSQPGNTEPPAVGGPAAALGDLLSAACSQSEKEFTRMLTARNAESFSRLAPAARLALMKRFVLLEETGKATTTISPSGRPTVRCQTPAVITEMQIGGADLRDNLAFLPLDLRDAADPDGASVHHITMGMVREDGAWKLLSLGLLLLDLPSLEVEWDQAEIEKNESAAIGSVKKIAEAIETYRKTFTRLPESIAPLGPPLHGAPNREAAGLVDGDLATGRKNGYAFRYVILGGNSTGAPAKYELAATPLNYQRTGVRSFFRDAQGGLHAADRKGAVGSETDPKVE